MFEKILVAVDGSKYSDAAFDAGMDVAEKYNSAVLVLHVYQVETGSGATATPRLNNKSEVAGQRILDSYQAKGKGTKVKMILKRGDPAQRIIETAKAEKCGLIVMGSRGRGAVREWLLGSVGRSVTQDADMPVLIVK